MPAMLMIMIWDGLLIFGEGFGLEGRAARRFADVAWIALAAVLGTWLAVMAMLTPGVFW